MTHVGAIVGYALSIQQRRARASTGAAGARAVHSQVAIELEGFVAPSAIGSACRDLAARHDALRTTFVRQAGASEVQVVADEPFAIALEAVPAGARADEVADRAWEAPFDLATSPGWRVSVVGGAKTTTIVFTAHSMVADVRSLTLVAEAVVRSIESRDAPSDEVTQYPDYVAWQDEMLAESAAPRAEPSIDDGRIQLPWESRSRDRTAASTAVCRIEAATLDALRRVAERSGCSAESLFAAAVQTLLWRVTGQTTVNVGVERDGRELDELASAVGPYARAIPVALRLDAERAIRFDRLLRQTHASLVSSFEAHATWEQSDLRADVASAGIVVFDPRASDTTAKRRWRVVSRRRLVEHETCAFEFDPADDGCAIRVTVSDPHAAQDAAARMASLLPVLLRSIAANADAPISGLAILEQAEVDRLVASAGSIAIEPRDFVSVVRTIESLADAAGDASAISAGEASLTRNALDRRSNQVAHRLRALGIGAESFVGVCVRRSIDVPVAILGVLKSGAAYVPLDPEYPEDRLAFVLHDAGVKVIVVDSHETAARLPTTEAHIVALREDAAALDAEPVERIGNRIDAGHAAYVIYTSGSTGAPKGVVITHGSLAFYVHSLGERLGIRADDVYVHTASISFSSSVRQLMVPLSRGARVSIASSDSIRDPGRFLADVRAAGGTVLDLVPSHWRSITDSVARLDPATRIALLENRVRLVVSASEPLPPDLPRTWRSLFRHPARLVNMLGQTETCGIVVTFEIPREFDEHGPTVPVGSPIEGARNLVLDRHMRPLPVGVRGELFLGGGGLARAYLGRADFTADRFVPDPFSKTPGARLYRTGDVARLRADGLLEFCGRNDDQIKIRGMRVEPGEIEAWLRRHPAIRECAVTARDDRGVGRRLVAYVVARPPFPTTSELRAQLAEHLPDYMIPSAIVLLSALPRTPNGKVDRRALPSPDEARPALEHSYVAPRDDIETEVARLWSKALRIDRVGIHDRFTDLGGQSILAVQLVDEVRAVFRVDVPIAALLQNATVEAMARAIRESRGADPETQDASRDPIVPQPAKRFEPFALTDLQQAYWIGRSGALDIGSVGSTHYDEIEFPALDIDRFQRAVRALVARHDMLRVVVRSDGRQQVLERVPDYVVSVTDLRDLAAEERIAALAELREKLSHIVLDPSRWPVFDIRAARIEGTRVRLFITTEFMFLDGWSNAILRRELLRLYEDPEARLPRLELTFRDCIEADVDSRSGESFVRAQRYWSDRVATLPLAPPLPLHRDPSRIAIPRFERRRATLAPADWSALQARARTAGITPSALLCAVYAEVLATWSGKTAFTINLTTFNRPARHPQIHEILGDFTSVTLLAVDASRDCAFADRASRLQRQLWNDLAHRQFTGVAVMRDMVRQGRVRAGGAVMPVVFTSTLALTDVANGTEERGARDGFDLQGDAVYSIGATPQVWLDNKSHEANGALVSVWDSVDELFPPGLVEAMFSAYQRLLERLARDGAPWTAVHLDMLPADQRERRNRVNATDAPVPRGFLHDGFIASAQRAPDATAVITPARSLTYAELHRRVRHAARQLVERGIGRGSLVAVVMDKGWEQVVAVLAIVQAGAAYLPIASDVPSARLAQLLAIGEAKVAFTQPWLDALDWPDAVERIVIDDAIPADVSVSLPTESTPGDLAYVIFTSGSTGVPKGVMIDHRGALNTIVDVNARFRVTAEDRVLALSALNFDLSVWDIFGLLAAGGAIVIPDAARARDPAHWVELVERHGVTIWNSVPALVQLYVEQFADDEHLPRPRSLRLVMMSGDWIPVALPARIREVAPHALPVSLGGATEASIWSILHVIDDVPPSWTSIPYGVPMVNQSFHVLDDALEPSPDWVSGHLFIGGIGLARGYFRDEAKTAASFITHPRTGDRLYRTGDLGRYRGDGEIEFQGRQDQQVKIHGHRIELGEVEASLTDHPHVRAAVCAAVGEARGEKRLVAYVVMGDDAHDGTDDLAAYLRARLPEYMVPSVFVVLDALPLSANGKVDRARLPAVEGASDAPSHGAAAATPVEEIVAGAFARALRIARVARHDNFFALGGDSLSATRVVTSLRRAFGTVLPLRTMFDAPTVAGVAAVIESARRQGTHDTTDPITRRGERDAPLSAAQRGIWLAHQLAPNDSAYNVTRAVTVLGHLDVAALTRALEALVDRHEALRTTFPVVDGDPRQHVAERQPAHLEVHDVSGHAGPARLPEAMRLSQEISRRPFDLAKGPPFRVALVRVDDEMHVLTAVLHHIVADGWSLAILISDLAALYVAATRGTTPALPRLAIQLADVAAWEREPKTVAFLESQLAYWTERLKTSPRALELPADHARDASRPGAAVRQSFAISRETANAIGEIARREGATTFMVLFAAFASLLRLYSGENDIVVGTPVAGRHRVEIEPLIGNFLNTLALRVSLDGAPSFLELVRRTRSAALDAYAHQDVPHERVLAALRTVRAAPGPLFRIWFALQNTPSETLELGALRIEPFDLGETGAARFDLAASLLEHADGIAVNFEFDRALFEADSMTDFGERFVALVRHASVAPDRSVLDLGADLDGASAPAASSGGDADVDDFAFDLPSEPEKR